MVATTLARYYAARAVRADLASRKVKLAEVDAAEVRRAVEVWLDLHRAELLALAELTIAASPKLQRMVAVQKTYQQRRAKSPAGSTGASATCGRTTIDRLPYRTER